MSRYAAAILLIAAGLTTVTAQAPSEDVTSGASPEAQQRSDALLELLSSVSAGETPAIRRRSDALPPPVIPTLPEGVKLSPATDSVYQEALREYFGYFKGGISHRRDVFEWQLFSSRIIFWVVLSLVALGMYFAAMQFQVGLRRTPAPAGEEVTEIAASLAGLKVRSPVLGVAILTISLAFFYLYLMFVYPVSETF